MKRIDKNLTQKELIGLIVKDPIGRNADLVSMAETILSIEGGMTYFLDGDSGSGKTFFAKQLKIVFEALNPNVDSEEEMLKALRVPEMAALQSFMTIGAESGEGDGETPEPRQSPSYLPVCYNACENGYWDDSLPPIIQTIAWQAGGSGKVDSKAPLRNLKILQEIS